VQEPVVNSANSENALFRMKRYFTNLLKKYLYFAKIKQKISLISLICG